jgi:radical SAM-linked protein
VIERAVELGCRFDGWREHFRYELWLQAMADCGLDPIWYLRERQLDEILPWEHIDAGLDKDFLLRELYAARAEQATADCRTGPCSQCGVCDFKSLRMRLTDAAEISPLPVEGVPTSDDLRFRYRLQLRKDGRARFVSHLEYINVLERAARRAKIPLRYSQGFHPSPKFSFSDALPTGVASDAELIDLELFQPLDAGILKQGLGAQLPEGFEIIDCRPISLKTASTSASVDFATFRVELQSIPAGLNQRLQDFLQSEQVVTEVLRKEKLISEDLRPDVVDLQIDGHNLLVSLHKGGPYRLLVWLLESDNATVRQLTVRKIAVSMKPQPDGELTEQPTHSAFNIGGSS